MNLTASRDLENDRELIEKVCGEDGDMERLTGRKTYSSPLCMFCAVDSAHLYRMSGVVADIHPLCSIICYS